MKRMYLMIGFPRSGKSTFVNDVFVTSTEIISADNYRTELTGDKGNHSKEKQVWNKVFTNFNKALEDGRNIVIDNTNLKFEYRMQFVKPAIEKGYTIIYIHFDTGDNEIRRRIKNTGFPMEVYERMKSNYEPVTEKELEIVNRYHRMV